MEGSSMKKIPKGRGFVYEYEQHLYQRVKTEGDLCSSFIKSGQCSYSYSNNGKRAHAYMQK